MNEIIKESLKSNYVFGNSCGFRKVTETKKEENITNAPEGKLDFSVIAKQSALLNESEEPINFEDISKDSLYEKKFDLNPFKEDFNNWSKDITTKTEYTVEGVDIVEDERTKGTKAEFKMNDTISEKEKELVHEAFTASMPDKIADFISENNLNFEFLIDGKNINFVVW